MNTKQPDISIIIVNYKSWSHLEACLLSIEKSKGDDVLLEVIIVDNCSNDGRLEEFIAKFSEMNFVLNSGNNGFANACNKGAQMAQGHFFMFLNPDTEVKSEVFTSLLKLAKEHPEYKLLNCHKKNNNGQLEKIDKPFPSLYNLFGLSRAFLRKVNKKTNKNISKEHIQLIDVNWLSGSLVFMSKAWYTQIQGWDEDYWMYYEDVDLSKRSLDQGAKIGLDSKVSILHNHGGSSRINPVTSAMTKAEVISSRHVYIDKHFKNPEKWLAHFF